MKNANQIIKIMKPLKNSVFVFLLSVFAIYSCKKSPAPLTEAEKEGIKNEVREVFSKMNVAINSHNVADIMRNFYDHEDFFYAASGNIFPGVTDIGQAISSTHTNPEMLPFSIEFNEVKVLVLNYDMVMLTAIGRITRPSDKETGRSLQLIFTYLMKKIDGKWLITVGHESTADKVL